MLWTYVESRLYLISFLDKTLVPPKTNFLFPLDDMTAVHSWIQAEHSQRHDLTISNIGEDVSDIFIVKLPWEMDGTDATVDHANTDSCVSVAIFYASALYGFVKCSDSISSYNLIHPDWPLPIHSYSLTLISFPLPHR